MGCAHSEFGCCSDGVTAAQGPAQQGCGDEGLIVGGCAGTRHGCCPDGVSPAHGPNYHGCELEALRPPCDKVSE